MNPAAESSDLPAALRLSENSNAAFMGVTKSGTLSTEKAEKRVSYCWTD